VSRATMLVMSDFERLEEWCRKVRIIFAAPPYLVGSVLSRADYKDVDLRLILSDRLFDRLRRGNPMTIRFINRGLSIWGQQETGLPIDFQVQRQTEANQIKGVRNPMGIRDWSLIDRAANPPAATEELDVVAITNPEREKPK
jgi:hypothetical protein